MPLTLPTDRRRTCVSINVIRARHDIASPAVRVQNVSIVSHSSFHVSIDARQRSSGNDETMFRRLALKTRALATATEKRLPVCRASTSLSYTWPFKCFTVLPGRPEKVRLGKRRRIYRGDIETIGISREYRSSENRREKRLIAFARVCDTRAVRA